MKRFDGRVVLITGGAQGIGRSIAARLAKEGGRVIIADVNTKMLAEAVDSLKKEGITVIPEEVNIANEESVKRLAQKIRSDFNRIDVVVNSAGIVGPNGKKIVDVALEDFENTYAVNLRGSFLVCKYFIPLMEENNYGRILLIASIAGKEGNAGMCPYSATKAGAIGLAKAVGKEYAETGIRINALAPAVIRTGLVEAMDKKQIKYMEDKIPMKRFGSLEEIASLVSFIVSEENEFTTAFTYDMSGGRATY